MNPTFLLLPMILQAPPAPLPVLEAKDLPTAVRGPLPPSLPDLGADRSMMGRMRHQARKGPGLTALQLPAGNVHVTDKVPDISGWKAYAIEVPGGGSVKVHLVEGRKAWFRVLGVNAWGRQEPGLLQNRIPVGEPQATYFNPTKEVRTVYFIVDTLDVDMVGEPYGFDVIRG